jgi:UDP-N-acetylmuramoylalanine--D-glutamate ligase
VGLPVDAMLIALRTFSGLPHRCQWLGSFNEVHWYNDSKGTNVGATLAAMEGLSKDITGKWIWIAGGQGKGADFSLLRAAVACHVHVGILLGQDAGLMAQALQGCTPFVFVESLAEAVNIAKEKARAGDGVLLSPACASLDMFRNYEERGEIFADLVRKSFP